jgi:hypothetical protein
MRGFIICGDGFGMDNATMEGNYVLVLTILLSILLLLIQRTEAKYRLLVTGLLVFTVGALLRNFVVYRQRRLALALYRPHGEFLVLAANRAIQSGRQQ